jgi:hypothetical protein
MTFRLIPTSLDSFHKGFEKMIVENKISVDDKTKFFIAVKNFKTIKTEKKSNFTDITAQDENNQKILLRSLEPTGRNGFVSVDDVKEMSQTMKQDKIDHGILSSKRFTSAAENELKIEKIQKISDEYMPYFDLAQIYLAINNCVNLQCKAKCGKVPMSKADCKPNAECKVRAISDNAIYHYAQSWSGLLENDLKQLLLLSKPLKVIKED